MTTAIGRAAILLSALFIASCDAEPPQWCIAACERDGGVSNFMDAKPFISTRCNDGMFFPNENVPDKCIAHGGVKSAGTFLTIDPECFCNSGGLISKP
jgi:hypothetical protein